MVDSDEDVEEEEDCDGPSCRSCDHENDVVVGDGVAAWTTGTGTTIMVEWSSGNNRMLWTNRMTKMDATAAVASQLKLVRRR